MTRPKNLLVSTVQRNQRFRGPTSSAQQNDMQAEIIRDLTSIQQQWNNLIVPLLADVPDGTDDSNVNAFLNGLDGQTLYCNADATANLSNGQYFNSINGRPNTIYEQFQNIYTSLTNTTAELENAILALGGGSSLETLQTLLQTQIDSNAANITGLQTQINDLSTDSSFRRQEVAITSLADTSSVAIAHNAGMYPQVQIMTAGILATAGYGAGEVLPAFDPNVASAAGVQIVHDDTNNITVTNQLGETLVSGVAIINW